jgi:hypothetical protein
MIDLDEFELPVNLSKLDLEDHLEGGFDRIAREKSEAITVDLSLSKLTDTAL